MLPEICSLGDVMLGENLYHFGRGIVTHYLTRYRDLIESSVRQALFRDIAALLLNFECSLTPDARRSGTPEEQVYRAPETALDVFNGVDAVVVANVANNHFSQHGPESACFTVNALQRRGIHVVGRERTPLKLQLRGRTCCIWGVSLVPDSHACGAYFASSPETLLADLYLPPKQPRDYWILCVHWGDEYVTQPNPQQRKLAAELSRRGFSLIFGHHPHVVQPVERVGSQTLVLYSQGNFIFDQNFSRATQTGLAARIGIETGDAALFLTRQKRYRVQAAKSISPSELPRPRGPAFDRWRPFQMRLLMKLELAAHVLEVDRAVAFSMARRLTRLSGGGSRA